MKSSLLNCPWVYAARMPRTVEQNQEKMALDIFEVAPECRDELEPLIQDSPNRDWHYARVLLVQDETRLIPSCESQELIAVGTRYMTINNKGMVTGVNAFGIKIIDNQLWTPAHRVLFEEMLRSEDIPYNVGKRKDTAVIEFWTSDHPICMIGKVDSSYDPFS